VLEELAVSRDRFALINAPSITIGDDLVGRLVSDLSLRRTQLGRSLAKLAAPPTPEQIVAAAGDAEILQDIDLLLWPEVRVDVLAFLRGRARNGATLAVWPGIIDGGRATYSDPGRPDYYTRGLTDCLILTPRGIRYPDEVPFVIERITV